jgi:hypothetical protein
MSFSDRPSDYNDLRTALDASDCRSEERFVFFAAYYSFGVDNARARLEPRQGLYDEWKALCEVVTGAAKELDACVLLPRDDPDAIVLDLVHPSQHRYGRMALWWAGREG